MAALVFVRAHSNADAESVFSMVGLNKTRNSLALDGTVIHHDSENGWPGTTVFPNGSHQPLC